MNEGQITVIVAIYNTGEYLRYCLDSIIGQSYQKLQIILVDDGSTDHSGEICEEYARVDDRILLIHKDNEGLSVARNLALAYATGEYVSFIDSDDVLHPQLFEIAVLTLQKSHGDFLRYRHCVKEEDLPQTIEEISWNFIDKQEATRRILTDEWGSQLWQYLTKRTLWDGIISPPQRFAQDMMVLHRVAHRAQICVELNHILYYYYQCRTNNVSNGNKRKVKGTADRAFAYWLRCEFCEENRKDILLECLKKATTYTLSSFCSREFVKTDKYKKDKKYFSLQLKKYRRSIFKRLKLPFVKKIAVQMILMFPNLLSLLKRRE